MIKKKKLSFLVCKVTKRKTALEKTWEHKQTACYKYLEANIIYLSETYCGFGNQQLP